PPRARFELFPLRAGPVGQLRRIFLRHRLHPEDTGVGGRLPQARGFPVAVGTRTARLLHPERRSANSVGWIGAQNLPIEPKRRPAAPKPTIMKRRTVGFGARVHTSKRRRAQRLNPPYNAAV